MARAREKRQRELFRYIIASGEMRYIERTERLVLLHDGEGGWKVRGVIPGCGPACDANLSQVILEFIMSCEGLDEETFQAALRVFAQKNGAAIVEHIKQSADPEQAAMVLDDAVQCLMNSLGRDLAFRSDGTRIAASFTDCPLCVAREQSGLKRHRERAHEVLFDMIRAMLYKQDPAARLHVPGGYSRDQHALEIEIIRPTV